MEIAIIILALSVLDSVGICIGLYNFLMKNTKKGNGFFAYSYLIAAGRHILLQEYGLAVFTFIVSIVCLYKYVHSS